MKPELGTAQVPPEHQQAYIDLTMALGEAATRLVAAERAYQAVLAERIKFLERVRYGQS